MAERLRNIKMRLIKSICTRVLIISCTVYGSVIATALTPEASGAMSDTYQPATTHLASTAWRLVKIMSMDDSDYEPDDRLKYTLVLDENGDFALQSDCNHGTGRWYSEHTGHLQFGPITSTDLQCHPDSISDKYLAQFSWVRSYVMKNGHLFLATMADGSIIEFEPVTIPVAATVYGEKIRTNNAEELQHVILSRLFGHYATANNLKATDEEVDKYVERMRYRMAADPNLTAMNSLTREEASQAEVMRREMGRALISQWKLNRALYQQYGGRVIYQQLGPEPLDAYRQYLEERLANGDFTIHEKVFEKDFWHYFNDDSIHSFYKEGSEAEAFNSPPWQ